MEWTGVPLSIPIFNTTFFFFKQKELDCDCECPHLLTKLMRNDIGK